MPRRLRAFFRTKTLQGGTGQLSLSGKDAILSKGGSPTPTYIPPSWNNPLPTFTFINGIASSQTFSGYFVDGNGGTSTITGANLPSGVTVNSAARTLVYDGNGAIASSSTATLTADDGYEDFVALTSLTVKDSAGTAGMVFKQGDVPSDKYISSTTVGFQARVKNWWPDGSAKIAVVSWSGVSASQASPLTVSIGRTATPPTGSDLTLTTLRSIATSGSVSLGSYGTVNLATVIAGAPFRTWQFGPKCSEWHWRSQVGSDLTLVVWFYVRLYGNGRVWIRVGVENGYIFIRDTTYKQTGKQYRAIISLNGTTRYDSATDTNLNFPSITYPGGGAAAWYWPWAQGDDLPHPSRTRWSLEFWYDGGAVRTPGHDGAYIIASKLVPNYYTTGIFQSVVDASHWVTTATPLMNANHRPDQQPAAAAAEIAYLPQWDCLYLLSTQGSANQDKMFKVVIANAVAAGAYRWTRHETTNLPVLWSDEPNLWSGDQSDFYHLGWQDKGQVWSINGEHEPAWAYTAYLLTGDFYHIETEQVMANSGWMNMNRVTREGVKGINWRDTLAARRFAWTLRNIIHACCVTPDKTGLSGDPVEDYHYRIKAIYQACIGYNCERYLGSHKYGTYTESDRTYSEANPFGYIVADINFGTMAYFISDDAHLAGLGLPQMRGEGPWQQNFVQFTLGHACELEVVSGSDAAYLSELTDFTLKMPVGMMGVGDSTGWPYPFGAAGSVPFWRETSRGSGVWTHAANWTDAYEWKISTGPFPDLRPVAASGGPMMDAFTYYGDAGANGGAGDPSGAIDSYWGNIYPCLSYAVDRGIPGAAAARARMRSLVGTTTPNNYPGDWVNDYEPQLFGERVQWAVVPR